MSGLNLKQKFLAATAGAILLGLSAQAASAATISSILLSGADQTPLLSDNSAEYLVNGPNDTSPNTVDIGDRLRGILQIGTIENPGVVTLGENTPNSELSALFEVVVLTKTFTDTGNPATSFFTYTFGAYAPFAAEADALGFAAVTGAAIAFFEDTTPDFTRTGGIALGETNASNGDAYWLFGFEGNEDFWRATTTTDSITSVALFPPTTQFGSFQVGLSLLDNPFGIDLGPVNCFNTVTGLVTSVNACAGSGQVLSPDDSNTGFHVWNDVNYTINVAVPEPGTLSIVGLGLLGLGYASRRRKSKKA
jgi:hypothetical protein